MVAATWARVLYDFSPEDPDELKLRKGDVIEVLDSSDTDGWWRGRCGRDTENNLFPANYVEVIHDDEEEVEDEEGLADYVPAAPLVTPELVPSEDIIVAPTVSFGQDTPVEEEASLLSKGQPWFEEDSDTDSYFVKQPPRKPVAARVLPGGWEAVDEEITGETYYWNAETEESRWSPPTSKKQKPPAEEESLTPTPPTGESSRKHRSYPRVYKEPDDEEAVRAALAEAEAEQATLAAKVAALRIRKQESEQESSEESCDEYVETEASLRLAKAEELREESEKSTKRLFFSDHDSMEDQRRIFAADMERLEEKRQVIALAARDAEISRQNAEMEREAIEARAAEAAAQLRDTEQELRDHEMRSPILLIDDNQPQKEPLDDNEPQKEPEDKKQLDLVEMITKVINERLAAELGARDQVLDNVRLAMEGMQAAMSQQQQQQKSPKRRVQRAMQDGPRSSRSEGAIGPPPIDQPQPESPRPATNSKSHVKLPKVDQKKQQPKRLLLDHDDEPEIFDENLPRVANLPPNKKQEAAEARSLAARAAVRYPRCKSIVFAPDNNHSEASGEPPASSLSLEHTHGYSGEPGRLRPTGNSQAPLGTLGGCNALWTLDGRRAVFPTAALVVVHDPVRNKQQFFTGHSPSGEGVIALARHPNQNIFASGATAPTSTTTTTTKERPRLCVWKLEDDAEVCIAEMFLPATARAVAVLRFSPAAGSLLVSVAADDQQTLTVWDWQKGLPLATHKIGKMHCHGIEFLPGLIKTPIIPPTSPKEKTKKKKKKKQGRASDDETDEEPPPPPSTAPPPMAAVVSSEQYALASCGVKNLKFWTLNNSTASAESKPRGRRAAASAPTLSKPQEQVKTSFGVGAAGVDHLLQRQLQEKQQQQQWALEVNAAFTGTKQPHHLETLSFTSMAVSSGSPYIVVGTDSGAVTVWEQLMEEENKWLPRGRCLAFIAKAHEGPILDLCFIPSSRLATAGRDGRLKLWGLTIQEQDKVKTEGVLELQSDVAVADLAPLMGAPRSLAVDDAGEKLLIGTQGNALAVLNLTSAKKQTKKKKKKKGAEEEEVADDDPGGAPPMIFHHGHLGRINAVATHPISAEVLASVGNDRTLRFWDARDRRLSQLLRLPDRATTLSFHPTGRTLAIGTETGELLLAVQQEDSKKWAITHRRRVARTQASKPPDDPSEEPPPPDAAPSKKQRTRAAVTDVKFSPDGSSLAAACMDKAIYVFGCEYNADSTLILKRRQVLKGHAVTPTHLDFDVSGTLLQSNDASREIFYWEVKTGKQQTNAFALRNTQWATYTCTLGWALQGIYQEDGDQEAEAHAVVRSRDSAVLAVPGLHNGIKLLAFPAPKKAQPKYYHAHRDTLSAIAFTHDDNKCISGGGKDATLAQWAHY